MTRSSYPLKLPASVKNAAQRLAKEDGVSLNQWISVAVAEKVGAVESAAQFLKRRMGRARPADMLEILSSAGTNPPSSDDVYKVAQGVSED